jgi:hypothetical protein
MSNINRRDYLKGMAATAAVIAAAKLGVYGHQSGRHVKQQRKTRRRKESTESAKLNWNITENPPDLNAPVTAVFHGLMGFAYDGKDIGKVGFHGHGGHQLVIGVYRTGDCANPIKTFTGAKEIELKVMPEAGQRVDYFEQNPNKDFNRFTGHANDFRWLPDLDSGDFYPKGYDKHPEHFSAWLQVQNATFYTLVSTNSTFKLQKRLAKDRLFGHVARVMAAAVNLTSEQNVLLIVDGKPLDIKPSGNETYQIVFNNECKHCRKPNLCSTHEEDWNDFHYSREVLKLPIWERKVRLRLDEKHAGTTLNICGLRSAISLNSDCQTNEATDEAPCMGAGYGADRL